ncbi:hypothetical protein [uncultured Tenacibaculum sp.]|uniref:hypothetical protein n=1 Tax=uncultured Tenacibaculum sp. TaxID=174713 RepID=UPI002629D287|nr:hypothetical protein [uncultured Tenacibaculum sp.]
MKIKIQKLLYWSIILQIIATQGLLTFIVFNYVGVWEIKKILHPLSILCIFTVFLLKAIKGFKISLLDIFLFIYLIIQFLFFCFNINSLESGYIGFRELFLIFVLTFTFHQLEIDKHLWYKILNLVFYLLILNSIFIIITYVLGPEKYMKWLTKRYYWGVDPLYNFQIGTFYSFLRSPALIGNAPSVGFFSFLAYVLMDNEKRFKFKKKIAFFPLFFSFSRSVYVMIFLYEMFKFFTKKEHLKKLVLVLKIIVPIVIFGLIFLSKFKILSTASLKARFYLWQNKINIDYNVLFGGAIGKVGGAARGNGFISILDSYWLFLMMSIGIIGIVLTILFFYEKSRRENRILFTLIAVSIAGIFVNLTQSIVILTLLPILFLKIKEPKNAQTN